MAVIGWNECDPSAVGMDPEGLARADRLVRGRRASAQLCVIRRGEVVLDRAYGCEPASLFWIFSAGKPYTAVLVHLLAQQGRLRLDGPVAEYWPEFARHGKQDITIRQVLQHRSGLATGGSALGDILAMTDWRRSVRRIENARPRWPAGAIPAYQFLSYGFILGELAQRVTGRPLSSLLRAEILDPLGAQDTFLGLPDEQWPRHVPIRSGGLGGGGAGSVLNRRHTRRAVIPAAGVSTTARDLALFYLMLLRGGSVDGVRVLAAESLEEARTPSSDGETDRFAKVQIRWSQGFQLGGPRVDPTAVSPMGRLSSVRAFGHNGSNCCIAWADPDRDLVFVYLTNRLNGRSNEAVRHHADVADAVIRAC